MPTKIIIGEEGEQVLYDSVTMTAFGVVHENQDYELADFLEWLKEDARTYTQMALADQYYDWLKFCQENEEGPDPYLGDGVFADNH